MNILKPAIIAAATTRLTMLVTHDELTSPLRHLVDDWAEGKPVYSFPERAQYLINCHRCSSVWAGALVLALSGSRVGMALVSTLAASQVAITAIDKLEEL